MTSTQLALITAPGIPAFALDANGYLITAAASGYSSWKSANGTTQGIDGDHDGDGVKNGIEYFLGGPNGHTTGFTALPGVAKALDGKLSVTWIKAATYPGVYVTDFVVETSDTLGAGSWTTETLGGPVTITGNAVKYIFPVGPVKKFARLKVTGP